MSETIRLSVCITTRNREGYIAETLESVLGQCPPDVEVVVVDGASTDRTPEIVGEMAKRYGQLRLFVSRENGGLDADFDKAVQAARGDHCWLFSDDDLMVPGAIGRVLQACLEDPTVVIVDVSVHGPDFRQAYEDHRLPSTTRDRYTLVESAALFRDCAAHLTYIGAVIVRRTFWLSRKREPYYGSEFIHCGVLFQSPIPGTVRVLRESLVKVRYGVGNWSKRAFEVWMYKWPALLWSFDWMDASVRRSVSQREPWRNARSLLPYRATGQYGWSQFREVVQPRATQKRHLIPALMVAATPGWLTYLAMRLAMNLRNPTSSYRQVLDTSPHRWGHRS